MLVPTRRCQGRARRPLVPPLNCPLRSKDNLQIEKQMNDDHQANTPNAPVVRHVASVAEIVDDVAAATAFYRDVLGMEVEHEPDSPYAVVKIPGIAHYGLWSRSHAAETLYGDAGKSGQVPLGISIAFEAESLKPAIEHVRSNGGEVIQDFREEPWGQKSARFLLPSGAVGELAETPWARNLPTTIQAQDTPGTEE
jgi:catechol 2,3-dioxygenase-like lactoylglutathione lyase family enzyme